MRLLVLRMSVFIAIMVPLSGCFNAAVTGAQTVYNRHSIQKNLKDQYITLRAYQSIHYDSDQFKDANITVATLDGEVLLAGQAPKQWQRASVEKIVRRIPDVRQVYNFVYFGSPSSALKRLSDTWITAKVKSKIIASNDLDATSIKVVTENGVVYLMGTLTPDDAKEATEIASQTDGVEGVVKMFSYIKITKSLA